MYIYENYQGWTLYLNSDIILDKKLKYLDLNCLDKGNLYGCYRYLCPTLTDFNKIKDSINFKELKFKYSDNNEGNESVGLGFFQMWNKIVFYNQDQRNSRGDFDATETDYWFQKNFKSVKPLGDYSVLHLGQPGVNWFGRKSERWI